MWRTWFISLPSDEQYGRSPLTQVIAHRGASFDFPENTLSAFQAACIPGVMAIEFDVQLSRDGVPVVFHDETFQRIGLGPKRCAELDSSALRKLDVGGWFDPAFIDQRLPLLDEVVEAITDREIWIEIKVYRQDWESGRTRRLANSIVERLDKAGAGNRTRILSFHRPTLEYFYQSAPHIRRIWNVKRPIFLDAITNAPPVGLDALDVSIKRVTPEFAVAVRRLGLSLMAYTCNTDEHVERAIAMNVDGLITDRPDWAFDKLRSAESEL